MICVKCHKEVPDGPFCCLCGAKQAAQKRPARRRGNGQGTAIKRGKTWTAIITTGGYAGDDGKYHQTRRSKGGFATKSAAYAYIQQMAAPESKSNFAALFAAYKAGPFKKLSESKQEAYSVALERWKQIYPLEVSEATVGDLQAILDRKTSTYYPARDMQSVLSHAYKIAMAQQMATVNLARLLTLPKLEEEEPVPFSEIEIHKLWTAYAAGDRYVAYALLMIYTGMMPGELFRLKADMVDMEAQEIRGCGLKTKKRKEAPIVFPQLMIPVLEDLIEHQGKNGSLCPHSRSIFYRDIYYKSVEAAGCRHLPPYSCRHTTATVLALGNIAPSAIQEVMRHSKLATTQRYIHMTSSEAHEAVATLVKGKEA